MRKIRVISPVTNPKVMETSLAVYRSMARTDTQISIVNLDQGPETIESLYEDSIAAPQVILRAIQAEEEAQQAVIIDCMNDPGLEAAREAVRIPVVGASQAAMMLAGLLCHKFSILSTAAEDRFAFEQLVRRYGLQEKYASTRSVGIPVIDLLKKPKKLFDALLLAAQKAIRRDGAHGLVFGCTAMKGMAAKLEKELKKQGYETVVIDPSLAALKWAEMLVDLNLSQSLRTYPPVGNALLPEHRQVSATVAEAVMGELDRPANIRIMVPVVQGFRKDDWLDGTLRDYTSYARSDSQVQARAIERGPQTIETHYLKAMAIPEMLKLAREGEKEGATAAIIDCMSDPSLEPAREISRIPVIGPNQACAFLAASLAHRFSILGTRADMGHKFETQVETYGIASKMASVRTIGLSVQEVETDPQAMITALADAGEQAVIADGAHCLIPGCTGMIGLAGQLQSALQARGIEVVVLEPPAVAIKMAEMLSDLRLCHSKMTYPKPPKKRLPGYEALEV